MEVWKATMEGSFVVRRRFLSSGLRQAKVGYSGYFRIRVGSGRAPRDRIINVLLSLRCRRVGVWPTAVAYLSHITLFYL